MKPRFGVLERLGCAVIGIGGHLQAAADAVEGLMVARLHLRPVAYDRRQLRPGRHRDVVLGEHSRNLLVDVRPDPVRHVLLDAAAERDVQHLRPAADGEHRQVALERSLHQRQLEVVALADHPRRLGVRLLAVQLRIEIRAARENQAVEGVERLREPEVVLLGRRHEQRYAAGPRHRANVRRRDQGGGQLPLGPRRVRYVVIPMTGRELIRA